MTTPPTGELTSETLYEKWAAKKPAHTNQKFNFKIEASFGGVGEPVRKLTLDIPSCDYAEMVGHQEAFAEPIVKLIGVAKSRVALTRPSS